MRQADRAVKAARHRAEASNGKSGTRAEITLAAPVDMRLVLVTSHALPVATELGVPQDAVVETPTAL